MHVNVGELGADVFVLDVQRAGRERVNTYGAARLMVAAEIHISLPTHGVEAEMLDGVDGVVPEDVVVPSRRSDAVDMNRTAKTGDSPLIRLGMNEEHDVRKVVVMANDEMEVGDCFAALCRRRDQVAIFRPAGIGRVDIGSPTGRKAHTVLVASVQVEELRLVLRQCFGQPSYGFTLLLAHDHGLFNVMPAAATIGKLHQTCSPISLLHRWCHKGQANRRVFCCLSSWW